MRQKNLSRYFGILVLASLFAPCLVFSQIVYVHNGDSGLEFCAKNYWGMQFVTHRGTNDDYTPGNTPFFPIGNSRYGEFAPVTAAKKPNQLIGYAALVAPGSIWFGGEDIPRIAIDSDPLGAGSTPPQKGIATVAVNWGMYHGHYSSDQGAHMQFAKWDNVTLIYNQQEAASFGTGSVSAVNQKQFSTGDCYSGLSKCKSPGVQMRMDAKGFPRMGLQLNQGTKKFAPTGKKLE